MSQKYINHLGGYNLQIDNDMSINYAYWTRELIRNEKGGCIGAKMICSVCHIDNRYDTYMKYCPNCGVKMERYNQKQQFKISDPAAPWRNSQQVKNQ